MGYKLFQNLVLRYSVIFLLIFCFSLFFCTGSEHLNKLQGLVKGKQTQIQEFSQDSIIVKFKPEAFKANLFSSKVQKFNQNQSKNSKPLFSQNITDKQIRLEKSGLNRVYKINLQDEQSPQEAIQAYENSSFVESAIPNYKLNFFATPNDTLYASEWHLPKVSAPAAWNIEQGETSVTVAVIDTGVDWDHPDLATNIWTNSADPIGGGDNDGNGYIDDYRGWDFEDNDNNPMDEYGHGTHVAGIAAAVTNNSTGVAGMAWNVKIMPLRTYYLDECYTAIEYASDMGVDVINASWGIFFDDETLRDWINYARDAGVIFVAAAGNNLPSYGYAWEYPIYPAPYNGVVAVAATNSGDQRASFSNYGSWIDIAAPGENIYSTDWNDTYEDPPGSGTSYSSPLVAGIAALLKSYDSSSSRERLENHLKSRIDNIGAENPNYAHKLGLGRANAEKVLSSSKTHPSGSILTSISTSSVYYIHGETKRHIMNPSVFEEQFNWGDITWVDHSELLSYPEAPYWRYPDGTLISNSGKAYVVEYQGKRWITTGAAFSALNYNWSNVIPVPDNVANDLSTIESIDSGGYHPSGSIIAAPGDPKVYILDNGQKRWIYNAGIFDRNYNWNHIIWVSPTEKNDYPDGDPIGRYDGSLIANSGKVFVLEYGEKRWLTDPSTFSALGYKWENIAAVDNGEAAIYPNGPDLTIP